MARDEGFISSKDGTRLFWRASAPEGEAKAHLAIVHGYGDHSGRYLGTIDALVAKGFSTSAIDYRGHGKADGARADVVKWTDYLDDMEAFWRKAKELSRGKPMFVLAHSHGALIATHWIAQKPADLRGAVLSAPFYALAFKPPPVKIFAAKLIRGILPGLSMSNELKGDQLSRDPAWQKETAADPLYLHSTTPRWFFECMAAQERLTGLGASLTAPLFMGAGSDDPIAATATAKGFFDTIGSADKTWKTYQGFRHEILNELGKEQVIDDIAQWISAHC
jgi:alpha-beta hydrolase superfamily lysophospholipase